MIDKNYCMSSYLAFRYIEDDDKDFFEKTRHHTIRLRPNEGKQTVTTASDIGQAIEEQLLSLQGEKVGLLLSGGMDSAILASYMKGYDAYTFRFLNGDYQNDELHRAEYFAKRSGMTLHYVDINWENTVETHLVPVLRSKGAPVHSIEPQIRQAAVQAKQDGVTKMVIGDGSDYIFGGMNQLLSKDWTFDAFSKRYTYLDPKQVLKNPVDMGYLYEQYRTGANGIDYLHFMDVVATEESYNSYANAFQTAEMPYLDPYACLMMAEPLDLGRVRNGESKYLIRELFKLRYPDFPVPEKVPMPRPVDSYFADWGGPVRHEFMKGLDMNKFTGNQKWQLYCLEKFLDLYEPEKNFQDDGN